jgi:iron complex outermembrane receptor protein
VLLGCGATAFAAHAAPGDLSSSDLAGLSLEDLLKIEVRVASRIPANTLTAASSVEVIPESVWQRRGARAVGDALEAVPGVALTPALAGADAFAIRGFTRSSSVTGVLVSWDGVPLNDLFRGAPMLNTPGIGLGTIDEIQVVEGPGSALHGADAFHGVVALRPYDAARSGNNAHVELRSNSAYSAGSRFGAELGERALLSVAVAADGQGDQDLRYAYADPATGAERAGERRNELGARSASVQLRGGDGGGTTWRGGALLHHYDGDDFQGFGTRLSGVRDTGGIDTDLVVVDGGMRRERAGGAALELSAYAWSSDSVLFAGRNTFDFESANEQSRWGVHGTYEKTLAAAATQIAVGIGVEELAIDEATTRNYDLTGALTLDRVNAAAGAQRRIYSATFEGQTRWSADHWRLVYGARSDDYSDFGSQVSPRVGLIWSPHPKNAVKLLYGEAFRAPTANELRGTPGLIQENPSLDPETVATRELVVMHQGDRWFMEGTLFASAWRDGITSVANAGGVDPFVFANLERNRSHGVTWKLSWQGDPWLFNVGAAWVRSENETRDEDYSAFPRYIVSAEASYNHPASKTRFYLVQRWQIDTDDVFQPSAGFAPLALPTYARTDVGANRSLGERLSLGIAVRNLFDRDNVQPSAAGSRGGVPDYGRTLGAEIRLAF